MNTDHFGDRWGAYDQDGAAATDAGGPEEDRHQDAVGAFIPLLRGVAAPSPCSCGERWRVATSS